MELIVASGACDPAAEIICAPADVLELFQFEDALFSIGGFHFTKTVFLIFLAMVIVLAILFFGLRGNRVVPTKFGTAVESMITFVKDEVAIGIIGPEGARYTPYLLSLFLFIIVGNLFEVTPFINFPIMSRMALPLFMAVMTWVIFVFVGFAKNQHHYFLDTIWPKSVPVALRPLVGLIELVSIFVLRPITLAVRLFANMVAGHLMLTLLWHRAGSSCPALVTSGPGQ
ncbi:MAG: F0F1 ATP synthase subunit A [Acidimicrobiia bacterium]|nr:F0F1 ATP synthase subunit A [Acidimicrobiia bacterium]